MTATKFSPYPYATAFAQAELYLSKGRKKTVRTVANNTELRRIDDDTIAVVLHHTAVVTYHRDGTFTIYGGGWNTPTTKDRISSFAPVRIHSHEGKWIVGYTGEYTPAKVQKCRNRECKGRGTWMADDFCYGPSHYGHTTMQSNRCYGAKTMYRIPYDYGDEEGNRVSNWSEHYASRYEVPCEHGKMEGHYLNPCSHGEWGRHKTGESERTCYRCDGAGVVDYGSKAIPITVTSDTPYKVDADGKYLGESEYLHTPYTSMHYAKVSSTYQSYSGPMHSMGSETATALESIVPGMKAQVKNPATGEFMDVSNCIIYLNDKAHWSRENIADWLDTLDVNLRFPTPTQGE